MVSFSAEFKGLRTRRAIGVSLRLTAHQLETQEDSCFSLSPEAGKTSVPDQTVWQEEMPLSQAFFSV